MEFVLEYTLEIPKAMLELAAPKDDYDVRDPSKAVETKVIQAGTGQMFRLNRHTFWETTAVAEGDVVPGSYFLATEMSGHYRLDYFVPVQKEEDWERSQFHDLPVWIGEKEGEEKPDPQGEESRRAFEELLSAEPEEGYSSSSSSSESGLADESGSSSLESEEEEQEEALSVEELVPLEKEEEPVPLQEKDDFEAALGEEEGDEPNASEATSWRLFSASDKSTIQHHLDELMTAELVFLEFLDPAFVSTAFGATWDSAKHLVTPRKAEQVKLHLGERQSEGITQLRKVLLANDRRSSNSKPVSSASCAELLDLIRKQQALVVRYYTDTFKEAVSKEASSTYLKAAWTHLGTQPSALVSLLSKTLLQPLPEIAADLERAAPEAAPFARVLASIGKRKWEDGLGQNLTAFKEAVMDDPAWFLILFETFVFPVKAAQASSSKAVFKTHAMVLAEMVNSIFTQSLVR